VFKATSFYYVAYGSATTLLVPHLQHFLSNLDSN